MSQFNLIAYIKPDDISVEAWRSAVREIEMDKFLRSDKGYIVFCGNQFSIVDREEGTSAASYVSSTYHADLARHYRVNLKEAYRQTVRDSKNEVRSYMADGCPCF